MTELTITARDVASFREKLDAWSATLSDSEQAILALVGLHAFADRGGVEPDDVEVEGYGGNSGRSFEIKDFSFGVENPTTIGSATGGAGAGKIKFDEFQIGLPATDAFVGLSSFVGLHVKRP